MKVPNHIETGERTKFCHFFSNYGRCLYEEKNGTKCKFTHIKAPVCNFDGQCTRNKCMYSHTKNKIQQSTKPQQKNHFLYQGRRPQISPWQQPTNLWQTIAPQMAEIFQNLPNMWTPQNQRENQTKF